MNFEAPPKPLNVLVFTGEKGNEDVCPRYKSIARNLQLCINLESYLVYMLRPDQVLRDPWSENLKLLVLSCDYMDECTTAKFRDYVYFGGQILIISSNLDLPKMGLACNPRCKDKSILIYKDFESVTLMAGIQAYSCSQDHVVLALDDCEQAKILKLTNANSSSVIIVSEVHLELDPTVFECDDTMFMTLGKFNSQRIDILRDILNREFELNCDTHDIPEHTPCYLLLTTILHEKELLEKINKCGSHFTNLKLIPVTTAIVVKTLPSMGEFLPIIYSMSYNDFKVQFDKEIFLSNLETKLLGRNLFFSEVVRSTMDIIYNLSKIDGACVVCTRQTSGKGRGKNKWISPLGSAMFSVNIHLSLSTQLGERLPVVQHLFALSVVLAVRSMPGYEKIDVRVKWPNDIYCGNNIKIGGVLIMTTIQGQNATIHGGIGTSINNSIPTVCINHMINRFNSISGTSLKPLTTEIFIARCLTELEKLIHDFQTNGSMLFLKLYYTHWIHDKQRVTLESTGEVVTITGLNEYGYLLVEKENKEVIALQPDGNSFDMMKNLITLK